MMTQLVDARLSVAEAAYVADVSTRAVDHEIDARVVRPYHGKDGRSVSGADLVYLRAVSEFRNELAPALRKRLRDAIVGAMAERKRFARVGTFSVAVDEVAKVVFPDLLWLEKVKAELVESNPAIMGGEPVLRGTRVPVRTVVDLLKRGISRKEIVEELDLSDEQIEAAATYNRVTPRRGRPRLNRREVAVHVPADR